MPGALLAVNRDSANVEQMAQQTGSKFGWIFDRQALIGSGVVNRDRSPQRQMRRSRLPVDVELAPGGGRRGHQPVVNGVVIRKRRDADEGFVARVRARQDVNENY